MPGPRAIGYYRGVLPRGITEMDHQHYIVNVVTNVPAVSGANKMFYQSSARVSFAGLLPRVIGLWLCLTIAACGGGGGGGGGAPGNVVVGGGGGGGGGGSLVVSWTSPSTLGTDGNPIVIAAFNVYRGPSASALVLLAAVTVNNVPPLAAETTFTDATVTSGDTFFYAVTAVDGLSNESPRSTVVSAVAP